MASKCFFLLWVSSRMFTRKDLLASFACWWSWFLPWGPGPPPSSLTTHMLPLQGARITSLYPNMKSVPGVLDDTTESSLKDSLLGDCRRNFTTRIVVKANPPKNYLVAQPEKPCRTPKRRENFKDGIIF